MTDIEPGELPTDAVLVRDLREDDLNAIVRIDREAIGRPRPEYYRGKLARVLHEGKLQTSLVAELDDHPVGFVLATLHCGEFGQTEPSAVIDSLGVDPAYRHKSVGEALMRQLEMNLRALGVARLETQVGWTQRELLSFLANRGFLPAARFCLQLDLS